MCNELKRVGELRTPCSVQSCGYSLSLLSSVLIGSTDVVASVLTSNHTGPVTSSIALVVVTQPDAPDISLEMIDTPLIDNLYLT